MTRLASLLEKIMEEPGNFSPKIDIIDYTNSLKILIELPGVAKENIKISFQNNIIILKGKYTDPEKEFIKNPEIEQTKMISRKTDIKYGDFLRRIYLDFDITNGEGINSKLENGILKIVINKNLQTQNTFSIKIND
jgi:HSP20 family protein